MDEFEILYRRRYREFLRVASAILDGEERGADAVHDAFARAISGHGSFRHDVPLEAWVWRIVINSALAARGRGFDEPELTGLSAEGEPLSDPYGVRSWIRALPERQRLAVFLRYFTDLDYRGIATALGVQIGTVSATLHAAHQALRRAREEVSHE